MAFSKHLPWLRRRLLFPTSTQQSIFPTPTQQSIFPTPTQQSIFPTPTQQRAFASSTGQPGTTSSFYKTFSRPIAKTLLLAVFTYQLTYWGWAKLEADDVRAEQLANIAQLEAQVREMASKKPALRPVDSSGC